METIRLTEAHREVIEWLASLTRDPGVVMHYIQEWLDNMKYKKLLASVQAEALRQEEIRQAKVDLFMKQTRKG